MSRPVALLTVFGVVALLLAAGVYLGNRDDFEPNNGPALFLLFAGAFMVLLAVILHSGQQRRT